jgi:endoglucanase
MSPRSLSLLARILLLLGISTGLMAGPADQPAAVPSPLSAPTFKRGISVGHWLAKYHDGQDYGAPWFSVADVAWIAHHGFDHIRYPVDGRVWLRADGSLDEAKIGVFLAAVRWGREAGLGTVLDMHFLPGGEDDPNQQDALIFTNETARSKAANFWGKVARRLKDEGAWLRFELINEPMAPVDEQLNALNHEALASIREVDATRVVYITSNRSSVFGTFSAVTVPNDPHVAIVLHYDEPLVFTHQRAPWKHCPPDMPLVEFPGRVPDLRKLFPADHFAAQASLTELKVSDIDSAFAQVAKELAERAPGKEVYLGEFGCYEQAPADSRRRYVTAVREAAERNGWSWAVWDYKSSFAVRGPDGKPTVVMESLFKPPATSAH